MDENKYVSFPVPIDPGAVVDVESLPVLQPRELLFVKAYIENGLSYVAAATASGVERGQALRYLCDKRIKDAVNALLVEYGARVPEVIARLTAQARGNIGDFLDTNGRIDIELVRKYGSSVVESIEYADDGSGKPVKIKLASQAKALEALAKVHALFTERIQVDVSGEVRVEENRRVMQMAMADPALLAKLGELAEALRERGHGVVASRPALVASGTNQTGN